MKANLISPTPITSCPSRQQPVAVPFPGPGNRKVSLSGCRQTSVESQTSPDSVFSHQDSCSSVSPHQEGGHDLSYDIPDHGEGREKRNGVSKCNESSVSSIDSIGLNRFAGCAQPPAKVEAFHGSLATHLSTILLSDNTVNVISSAQ